MFRSYSARSKTRFRPSDFTPTEWAYLAGIMDGEGTINYNEKRNRWVVFFSTTDANLLAWISRLGIGVVQEIVPTYTNLVKQPIVVRVQYRWTVTAMIDMWLLLNCLLPYLIVKRAKALDAVANLTPRVQQVRLHRRSLAG